MLSQERRRLARVTVGSEEQPLAEVTLTHQGNVEKAEATGDGGYDAFMNALRKAMKKLGVALPKLTDFRVRIPPGGRTAALVETVIAWESPEREGGSFSTLGVDSDQIAAAVIATEKMLNAVVAKDARK